MACLSPPSPSLPPVPGPVSSFPPGSGLPCAKNSTLIAIANPKCNATTATSNTLLVCLSVALRTGYKFLNKNATLTPNPTPTNTQFKILIGDQLTSATGIQIKFEYPYNAQHSKRLADSDPKYLSARYRTTGMKVVYP